MAEGARFELAVHEVDAGFQDRWFQPLTHPSDREMNYLARLIRCSKTSCVPFVLPFSSFDIYVKKSRLDILIALQRPWREASPANLNRHFFKTAIKSTLNAS
jgi:hypothetical protein